MRVMRCLNETVKVRLRRKDSPCDPNSPIVRCAFLSKRRERRRRQDTHTQERKKQAERERERETRSSLDESDFSQANFDFSSRFLGEKRKEEKEHTFCQVYFRKNLQRRSQDTQDSPAAIREGGFNASLDGSQSVTQ